MNCLGVIVKMVCWITYQMNDFSHFQLILTNVLVFHLVLEGQRSSYQGGLE